jgi:nucleotidyltransferase substrate binding protein (TIGR01987 family)
MPLNLENLSNATHALAQSLAVSEDRDFMDAQNEAVRNVIRSGVIQHFEFTYELCCSLMRRWLRENMAQGLVATASRRQMFRFAARSCLIDSFENWMEFNESRNLTSHTYRQDVAATVFSTVPAFLLAAQSLLARLTETDD